MNVYSCADKMTKPRLSTEDIWHPYCPESNSPVGAHISHMNNFHGKPQSFLPGGPYHVFQLLATTY